MNIRYLLSHGSYRKGIIDTALYPASTVSLLGQAPLAFLDSSTKHTSVNLLAVRIFL